MSRMAEHDPRAVADRVVREFGERFGSSPSLLVRAPGRVNLIGEHTDYNDGFVLPLAIDRAIWIALRPRPDRVVSLHSLDFDSLGSFRLAGFGKDGPGWLEYVKGTAWAMGEVGFELKGWEGVVAGDVPVGAGLSSSAALEMAALRAFAAVSDIPWTPAEMARLGQRAENQWVGVNCGIMDQMISASGREGHALLIDCRSLETRSVPLPSGVVVVILDTATRRGLVDSAYNERRRQCEEAARILGLPALRDIDPGSFHERRSGLPPLTARRAGHVVTENARTLEAAEAMEEGDTARLGRLMDASHESLRDDFQVSSEALDLMVEIARSQEGCLGARMTGAGFGGCAVALVAAPEAEAFVRRVGGVYQARSGLEPRLYLTRAREGAELFPVPPDQPVEKTQ